MSNPAAEGRRRDLIEQLTADSVASDYQVGEASRAGSGGSRRQHLMVAAIGLGLAGLVLAMGLSNQLTDSPIVHQQREALVSRVRTAQSTQEQLVAQIAQSRQELEALRANALELSKTGQQLTTQIAGLEQITAYSAVSGPGAVVKLSDSPLAGTGSSSADVNKVLDSDLQQAVNGLWRAGAEAIAINGQRLTARTAIRSAAGAILVNYRPLTPPYEIQAIGNPASLVTNFTETPDYQALLKVSKKYGIGFQTSGATQLHLEAATAALPDETKVVQEVTK